MQWHEGITHCTLFQKCAWHHIITDTGNFWVMCGSVRRSYVKESERSRWHLIKTIISLLQKRTAYDMICVIYRNAHFYTVYHILLPCNSYSVRCNTVVFSDTIDVLRTLWIAGVRQVVAFFYTQIDGYKELLVWAGWVSNYTRGAHHHLSGRESRV